MDCTAAAYSTPAGPPREHVIGERHATEESLTRLREHVTRHEDVEPLIAERGYRLIARRPMYTDPLVQRHGFSATHYWLFERAPA